MTRDFKQIDSTVDVKTPENIAFQYQVVGPFRRFPAFLIDLCVRFAVWLAALLILSLTGAFAGIDGLGIAIWLVIWFVLEWFYGGILETYWNGQTVGKRLLGMRVLQVDGQPINGLQAVMRNILRLVDMMPLIPIGILFGIESIWAIPSCLIGLVVPVLNPRFQRLGDLVCGTMVIAEQRGWVNKGVAFDDPRIPQLAALLPRNFSVSRKLGQALASYIERRRFLSAPRRQEIAANLGSLLLPRFNLPLNTSHDLLLCALYHRTFVESRENPDDVRPTIGLLSQEATRVSQSQGTGVTS